MFRKFNRYPLIVCSVLIAGMTGCHNVPVTGRKAVSTVSDEAVVQQSLAEFEKIKAMNKLTRNQRHIDIVNRVGRRISQAAFWDVPLADWEFVVFDAPKVMNAFAMSGGKVGVFSGLIEFCENEDQLASVIAHEIGHVAAKHTNERFSQQMLIKPVGAVANAATAVVGTNIGGVPVYAPVNTAGLTGGVGMGTHLQLSWDRKKELEADHIGLIYMAKAGYDPQEALVLMKRMGEHTAASGGPTMPAWLSNHPGFPERQVQMMKLMDEALETLKTRGQSAKPTIIE